MKIRKINAAAALGSLTASVALLAGMSGAYAQGAPGAGSYPGSFLVPGSQTSFSVTGFVQLLYSYDFSQCTGALNGSGTNNIGYKGGFILDHVHVASSAGVSNHGCSDFTPGTSRFYIQTRTPTAYGELKTFISTDFQQAGSKTNSNRMVANMREAYGTLGPLLAGQTISNFRDASVEAEVIDNGGPSATSTLRMPQVRYTFDFGNGLALAVAAENAQTKLLDSSAGAAIGGTAAASPIAGLSDKIPDFTAKLQYNAPWGHVNLRGVVEDLYYHSVATNQHDSTVGWGIGVAGSLTTWGKDSLNGAFNYGDGAGRYVGGSGSPQIDGLINLADPNSPIQKLKAWQVQANYAHFWFDNGAGGNLRSNILGSYYHQDNSLSNFEEGAPHDRRSSNALMVKSEWYGAINLIWSPVPQVDFGIEYAFSQNKLEGGLKGEQSRINAEATFRF